MNDFKKNIQAEVEGIKQVYESSDIYVRENHSNGECRVYSIKNGEKINDSGVRMFLANIEDESDRISYKILSLQGEGLKMINEQEDKFSLYKFGSIFQALSGERLLEYTMITKSQIDKLIDQYRLEKSLMKYFELEKVTVYGLDAYVGKYLEQGRVKQEELFGNVFSRVGLTSINDQRRQVIIDNKCLQVFESQSQTLKFTAKAVEHIIEKDRNRGK